jgi:hypothetical protein
MSSQRFFMTMGIVLLCVLSAKAQQSTMTEEEYSATMTEINFIIGDAELHIDARYWPELFEDLGKLRTQFEQVEAFWSARGSEEAVGFAQNILEGLAPIGTAGDEKDTQAASSALRALRTSCQSCHDAFREQGSDGYRIKD